MPVVPTAAAGDYRPEVALYNQADDLMDAEQYDAAIEILRKAITQYPDFSRLYVRLADAYTQSDRPELGLEAANAALKKSP